MNKKTLPSQPDFDFHLKRKISSISYGIGRRNLKSGVIKIVKALPTFILIIVV